jgi:hypothetical protein
MPRGRPVPASAALAFSVFAATGLGWQRGEPAVPAALASAPAAARRPVVFGDLPLPIQQWLHTKSVDADGFDAFVRGIDRRSSERRDAGEREHLIYFILQSRRFTSEAPIEPALSAAAFVKSLPPEERERLLADGPYVPPIERIPAAAAARLRAFAAVRRRAASAAADERLAYFARLLPAGDAPAASFLAASYAQAMRFLYLKEFAAKEKKDAEQETIGRLYQERGYNTDTGFEANFAVDVGLSVFKSLAPADRLHRVLIVGPGLDLAPRTDLVDLFPPQSYQPYAVADSLIRTGLADGEALRIHCVDVNDAVVAYVTQVKAGTITRLSVLSGVPDRATRPLSDDYRKYFREFGTHIGVAAPGARPHAGYGDRLYTSIRLEPRIAARISAERFNIITERYAGGALYDLVVVTNVLTYFDDVELALALANIASLLRAGGLLVHNEVRPALEFLSALADLPPAQVRSVLIAPHPPSSLYDTVWLHRKR